MDEPQRNNREQAHGQASHAALPPESSSPHTHSHGIGGHHHHGGDGRRALSWSLGANAMLLVVQVIGAISFGSLALLADSVHQGSDVVGLVIALVAMRLASRPRSSRYSFGLRRAEVVGATLNAALLFAASVWIIVEATRRLGDTPEIDGLGVLILALVGLAVNGASAWWLWREAPDNLNARAAMVHLASDAAGSLGVVIVGIGVTLADATWLDPLVSYAIAMTVMWHALRIIAEATRIVMMAVPEGLDVDRLAAELSADPDVVDVHHIHAWALDSTQSAMSAHLVVNAESLHDAQVVRDRAAQRLSGWDLSHLTLEVECHSCADVSC